MNMNQPPFFQPPVEVQPPFTDSAPSPGRNRIIPWRRFIGSIIPNWLQCRKEISPGAKVTYARLAQYAGRNGECFPKQRVLAIEVGVSERTVREYLRELKDNQLIESVQNGLKMSNNYFFLDHPWIQECKSPVVSNSAQDRQTVTQPDRSHASGQDRQYGSAPNIEEIHWESNHGKRIPPSSPPTGDSVPDTNNMSARVETIYAAYPKKVGRPAAYRAIKRALGKKDFEFLLNSTRLFAETCNAPIQYIPNPATWFNDERYLDDPQTWRRTLGSNGKPQPAIIRAADFGCGESTL